MSTQDLNIKELVRTILQAYYKNHQIDGEPLESEVRSLTQIANNFIKQAESAKCEAYYRKVAQRFRDEFGEEAFKAFMDSFEA